MSFTMNIVSSNVIRSHPAVGSSVWFNQKALVSSMQDVAMELKNVYGIRGLKAVISGILLQDGKIAGYEVKDARGNTHTGNADDFYITGNKSPAINDVLIHDATVNTFRRAMRYWRKSKYYYGPFWDGMEKIYTRISPLTGAVAIEPNDWVYDISDNPNREPPSEFLAWKMIVPMAANPAEIHFLAIIGQSTWNINTNITDSIESAKFAESAKSIRLYGAVDPWTRAMIWLLQTIAVLFRNERRLPLKAKQVRQSILNRMAFADSLHKLKIPMLLQMHRKYKQLFGDSDYSHPDYISIVVSAWELPVGKQSFYMPPHYDIDLGWISWGTIIMHPDLSRDPQQARAALIHQLGHSLFNTSCIRGCNANTSQKSREMHTLINSM